MTNPIIHDKAKYHLEGRFPKDLPEEQAFVHTGFFVAWLANNNLLSEETTTDLHKDIELLKARKVSPIRLYEILDGVFADDIGNDIGKAFTEAYFDFEKGQYLNDYEEILYRDLPSFFHVADTWDNYDKIALRIDKRFRDWQANRQELLAEPLRQ